MNIFGLTLMMIVGLLFTSNIQPKNKELITLNSITKYIHYYKESNIHELLSSTILTTTFQNAITEIDNNIELKSSKHYEIIRLTAIILLNNTINFDIAHNFLLTNDNLSLVYIVDSRLFTESNSTIVGLINLRTPTRHRFQACALDITS